MTNRILQLRSSMSLWRCICFECRDSNLVASVKISGFHDFAALWKSRGLSIKSHDVLHSQEKLRNSTEAFFECRVSDL